MSLPHLTKLVNERQLGSGKRLRSSVVRGQLVGIRIEDAGDKVRTTAPASTSALKFPFLGITSSHFSSHPPQTGYPRDTGKTFDMERGIVRLMTTVWSKGC